MFILYAVAIGLAIGFLVGGRPSGLAALQFRWGGLFVGGLLAQLVLFSPPVTERVGDLGPPIYVASTALVALVVLANIRVPGMILVALGAAANFLAIAANGGYMPAAAGALTSLGKVVGQAYSNSATVSHPAVEPLTDIFALPRWVPFANVFSLGDVLIATGVAVVIVLAMRRSPVSEVA
jgi:hypothetical protein